jgi:hypothetical protein
MRWPRKGMFFEGFLVEIDGERNAASWEMKAIR